MYRALLALEAVAMLAQAAGLPCLARPLNVLVLGREYKSRIAVACLPAQSVVFPPIAESTQLDAMVNL